MLTVPKANLCSIQFHKFLQEYEAHFHYIFCWGAEILRDNFSQNHETSGAFDLLLPSCLA